MRDIGRRVARHQQRVLSNHLEPVALRQAHRGKHVDHGIGVRVVELDVLETLRDCSSELLGEVLGPADALRVDLALVIFGGGVRGLEIRAIRACVLLIKQIAVFDANPPRRLSGRVVGDLDDLAVTATTVSVCVDQVAQRESLELMGSGGSGCRCGCRSNRLRLRSRRRLRFGCEVIGVA